MQTLPLYRPFISTLCAMLLLSCNSSRPLTAGVKRAEIRDLQQFETFSHIVVIRKGNQGMEEDSISARSSRLVTGILDTFRKVPITGTIAVTDSALRSRLAAASWDLCGLISRKRTLAGMQLPPVLDSVLERNGKRFALITLASGFTRTKQNYRTENLKGGAVGLATLGMYIPTPVKSGSAVYAMIVDAQENNVIYFRSVAAREQEPLSPVVVRGQVRELFYGYFK